MSSASTESTPSRFRVGYLVLWALAASATLAAAIASVHVAVPGLFDPLIVLLFAHIAAVLFNLGAAIAGHSRGLLVPVVSLGAGPRLFGVRLGGTDFRVSALPVGGYVRFSDTVGTPGLDDGHDDPPISGLDDAITRLMGLAAMLVPGVLALGPLDAFTTLARVPLRLGGAVVSPLGA